MLCMILAKSIFLSKSRYTTKKSLFLPSVHSLESRHRNSEIFQPMDSTTRQLFQVGQVTS